MVRWLRFRVYLKVYTVLVSSYLHLRPHRGILHSPRRDKPCKSTSGSLGGARLISVESVAFSESLSDGLWNFGVHVEGQGHSGSRLVMGITGVIL